MFDKRTSALMAKIVGAYLLLCVPLIVWPDLIDNPFGDILALPFISLYFFDAVGIPGLLDNAGACGWGWCGPSLFGILFVGFFWLMIAWFAARLIVHVTRPPKAGEK